jgi:hypothetical protein
MWIMACVVVYKEAVKILKSGQLTFEQDIYGVMINDFAEIDTNSISKIRSSPASG